MHLKKTGILNASRALNHQQPVQLVLRYIDGEPLIDIIEKDLLTPSERLTRERRILIARNMFKAVLEQVLKQGRIHRDLTPMNIMIRPNNDVTVFDFGLAQKVDETRYDCVGTPNYAPVEAFHHEYSLAIDVYYLAQSLALLFRTNTGYFEYPANSGIALMLSLSKLRLDNNNIYPWLKAGYYPTTSRDTSKVNLLIASFNKNPTLDIIIIEICDCLPVYRQLRECIINLFKRLYLETNPTLLSNALCTALNETKEKRIQIIMQDTIKQTVHPGNCKNILTTAFLALAQTQLNAIDALSQLATNPNTNASQLNDACKLLICSSSLLAQEELALSHLLFLRRNQFLELGMGLNDFTPEEIERVRTLLVNMAHYQAQLRPDLKTAYKRFNEIFPIELKPSTTPEDNNQSDFRFFNNNPLKNDTAANISHPKTPEPS